MDVVALESAKADAKKNYAKRGTVASPTQVAAVIHKLQAGVESVVITGLGDSTGAMTGSWLNGLIQQKLGGAFPKYTVAQRSYDTTNDCYSPVTLLVQTGTAGLRRYVSTGASTDLFFTVPDSASTSPTGDLDVRFKLTIPALGAFTLGGKYDTGTNNRSWFVSTDATGKLQLFFSTDGTSTTQLTRTATAVIPPAAVGVPVWLRVTFDVDDGAGNNVARFYYSSDNSAWFQIGSTVTNAGVQSIFDGTSPTQLNSRGNLAANTTGGAIEYHGMQVYTSLATGARPVIDMIVGLWHGYLNQTTFPDLVGNTVTVSTTGGTGSMQGAPIILFMNGCASGSAISYANDATRFPKLTPVPSDLCFINYSHNETGLVQYRAPFKQLADAVLAKWPDCGIIAVVQNKRYSPAANINEHQIRGDQIALLAASQRYGLVNAYKILEATGTQQQYINTDGIHPTIAATVQAGYGPGADVIRDGAWPLFSAWL